MCQRKRFFLLSLTRISLRSILHLNELEGKVKFAAGDITLSDPSVPPLPPELEEARRVAKNSFFKFKVGAVVTKRYKRLSCACNRKGSTTFRARGIHTPIVFARHAEIQAILQVGIENVRNGTVWVYRETKEGMPALARPCKKCMAFLQLVEIARVVYTISEFPYVCEETL